MVNSKQANKSCPQFRDREVEGDIIKITIIFKTNKRMHLYTLGAPLGSKGFSCINSSNPPIWRDGVINDAHFVSYALKLREVK